MDELGINYAEINGREMLLASFRGQNMIFAEEIIPVQNAIRDLFYRTYE